jgi:chromosomal replication initiator protein
MQEGEVTQSMFQTESALSPESLDNHALWELILKELESEMALQSIKTWLRPCQLVNIHGDVLFIRVPNQFFYEWIESHYSGLMKTIAGRLLQRKIQIEYIIPPLKNSDQIPVYELTNEVSKDTDVRSDNKKDILHNLQNIGYKLNQSYTFDRFIGIDHNRFARKAAEAIVRHPSHKLYNPLVIFGPTGVGKTHLVQAIGNEMVKSGKTVLYITGEKFAQDYVKFLKEKNLEQFVATFRQVDVLLLDDLHFLSGKWKLQAELLYSLNEMIMNGKQVVISLNKAPSHLKEFEPELISRLQSGLVVDVKIPDPEGREKIIENYFRNEGIQASGKIVRFLAKKVNTNIRELEGILIRLIAHVNLLEEELSLDLVKNTLLELSTSIQMDSTHLAAREVTFDDILNAISELYGKPVEFIRGKSRKRDVTKIRKLAVYCCKEFTQKSVTTIGQYFGRSHAFVVYSIKDIETLLAQEPDLELQIAKIKNLLPF